MTTDPIIEELHQTREKLAAQFNYDVFAIVADIQAQEQQENRPLVTLSPQRVEVKETTAEVPYQRAA